MWRAIWSSSWEGKARTLLGFAGAMPSGARPRNARFWQMRERMGCAVLADAAGEDEEVEAAHERGVGSDGFADGGAEGVDGECGGGVVGGFAREEGLHVGFAVGEGEEAALAVEELLRGSSETERLFVAEEVDENAGVEVAAAGAHGDAAGGREAHGGVDRTCH